MKRTILATVITATSFGAMAEVGNMPVGEPGATLPVVGEPAPIHGMPGVGEPSRPGTPERGGVIIDPIKDGKGLPGIGPIGKRPGINPGNGDLIGNPDHGAPKIPGVPSTPGLDPVDDITLPIIEEPIKIDPQPGEDVIVKPVEPIDVIVDPVAPIVELPIGDCEEVCVPDYADPEAPIEDMPTPIGAPDKVAEVKAKIKAHFDKEKFIGAPVEDESPVFGVDPIGGDPKHGNGENKGKVAKKVAEVIEERANEIRAELPEVGENATGKVIAASQNAQAQNQAQIDELYALGNQNASDIDTLFAEVDRLDTRIDQTQALNAATVNARPMVANGMTAFGAGVGYAGSEAALAIGVAHSFVDTGWSASGTLAASSDDVVVGGGVQYAF